MSWHCPFLIIDLWTCVPHLAPCWLILERPALEDIPGTWWVISKYLWISCMWGCGSRVLNFGSRNFSEIEKLIEVHIGSMWYWLPPSLQGPAVFWITSFLRPPIVPRPVIHFPLTSSRTCSRHWTSFDIVCAQFFHLSVAPPASWWPLHLIWVAP